MVAGTFHVPSAIQKTLVFVATAHGVCLLLFIALRSRRLNLHRSCRRLQSPFLALPKSDVARNSLLS